MYTYCYRLSVRACFNKTLDWTRICGSVVVSDVAEEFRQSRDSYYCGSSILPAETAGPSHCGLLCGLRLRARLAPNLMEMACNCDGNCEARLPAETA